MKRTPILACLAVGAFTLCLAGCGRAARGEVGRSLEKSFRDTAPGAAQTLAAVQQDLKAGSYVEAGRVLEPLLEGRKLNQPQREAVGLMFQQINQAIAANPAIDSAELYALRVRLAKAARGERF